MNKNAPIHRPIQTPDWVKHAIFYQIFPDRFANGDPRNDPENAQPWGSTPTPHNFMGGDLQGIIDRLDYLQGLGINALYLNPIFLASSNHKYNASDYFQIDPHFGDLTTFQALLKESHARGIKIVLDGVFNHCGRGFFAFNDLLENGEHSPYRQWFHIKGFPLHPYDGKKPANYECWWGIRSLPKFNTDHPPVRRYLLDIARYWLEQGIDGWRLDVPNEIDDPDFWREFRAVVKQTNPEAYIVGEIWRDASAWLQGDQFDAVMNYLFRDLCVGFFAQSQLTATQFLRRLDRLMKKYLEPITQAQLNLLGSHDTERFLTLCGGDRQRAQLAYLTLMTIPGAPCIYYGDEIGMEGGKDPDCRRCFPWNKKQWNRPLQEFIRSLIALRNQHAALRDGAFIPLYSNNEAGIAAYARQNESERFLIIFNNSDARWQGSLPMKKLEPLPKTWVNPLTQETFARENRALRLHLPARAGVLLQGS